MIAALDKQIVQKHENKISFIVSSLFRHMKEYSYVTVLHLQGSCQMTSKLSSRKEKTTTIYH